MNDGAANRSEHTDRRLVPQLLETGYGYNARIGFLRPGVVDETLACQFYRMAPPGVTIVQAGLGLQDLTVDQVEEAMARCDDAALAVAARSPDCILLGGSPTVIVDGPGADSRWAQHLADVTGIPASTAQTAALEAFRALGARRLAVASPFPTPMNEKLREFLTGSGFDVAALEGLGGRYAQLTQTPLSASWELAVEVVKRSGDPDALYFPGAPFPVADIIAPLEAELGLPVVSSMQATLWKGMNMSMSEVPKINGFGQLLEAGRTPPD